MWTLQRPNTGPDKKWRINKESKYSSLLRPNHKEQEPPPIKGRPPYIYRPMDPHPNPRMVNPKLDPRMPDPRYIYPKPMDPRAPPPADPKPNPDPRGVYAKKTDLWVKSLPKNPPATPSDTDDDDEEELYPVIEVKRPWIDAQKRADPPKPQGDAPRGKFAGGVFEKGEQRGKPLQELNGREKHVQRFLDSLESNNTLAPAMEVVSRQRILSKSRDDLNYDYEDDDAWYDLDTLIKEHIHEIRKKWEQIDDGIWAKAIVFEKNRRVAKAYVRPPILTINGMDTGFDGHRIGLKGFDNPMRDAKTHEVISRYVGQGVKVRMDDKGNIEVKKLTQSNVYVKPFGDENSINDELLKSPNISLEQGKQMVFDIKKFEQNVNKEARRPYPNRAKLEAQCIVALTFAKSANVLQCPSWVIIINIVALDMLRNKLPVGLYARVPNIKNRPRLPVPEEDPYSLTGGTGSGTSSGGSSGKEKPNGKDKPPKLPPRDNSSSNKSSSKGDYDSPDESIFKKFRIPRKNNTKEKERDDPYYCGLRARVPNFPKSKGKDRPDMGRQYPPPVQAPPSNMFHSRSFDSGMAHMQTPNHVAYLQKMDRNPCAWVPASQPGYASDWENYWVS